MELEQITPEQVESYLYSWKQGTEHSPEFLSLTCLNLPPQVPILNQHYLFFDWLEQKITNELVRQRESLRMETEPSWRINLRADFSRANAMLESWSALHHRYFVPEADKADELARIAQVSERQFRRRVESGLQALVEIIRREEIEANRQRRRAWVGKNIPQPEHQTLFGVEKVIYKLSEWLMREKLPKFVSLEGMGGIGKTSLALAVSEHLIASRETELQDVLWLSARQEKFTPRGKVEKLDSAASTLNDILVGLSEQLGLKHLAGFPAEEKINGIKPLLAASPYLIVVDNLETLQESQKLVPLLREIAGTSSFLFTSRHTLNSFEYVRSFLVPELSKTNSYDLINSEISRRGKELDLSQPEFDKIYSIIGGLPLALKLVAAQIVDLSLDYALNTLQQAHKTNSQEQLYGFIYKRSWECLSNDARQLLLSMLMVPQSGEIIDWIAQHSSLPGERFEPALIQLLDFSLLESRQHGMITRYAIHRLTASFLKSNILNKWAEA